MPVKAPLREVVVHMEVEGAGLLVVHLIRHGGEVIPHGEVERDHGDLGIVGIAPVEVEGCVQGADLVAGDPGARCVHGEDVQELGPEGEHVLLRLLRLGPLLLVIVLLDGDTDVRLHLPPCRRVILSIVHVRLEDKGEHAVVRRLSQKDSLIGLECGGARPFLEVGCRGYYEFEWVVPGTG